MIQDLTSEKVLCAACANQIFLQSWDHVDELSVPVMKHKTSLFVILTRHACAITEIV